MFAWGPLRRYHCSTDNGYFGVLIKQTMKQRHNKGKHVRHLPSNDRRISNDEDISC